MYEENADKRLHSMKDGDIFRRLMTYAKPFKKQFTVIFILIFLTVVAVVLEPVFIGRALDLIEGGEYTLPKLLNIVYILAGILVVTKTVDYVVTIKLQTLGQSIIYNIRDEIFTHLEHHDIAYLNSTPTGAFVTRVTNDTNTLNEAYTTVVSNVVRSTFLFVAIITIMFVLNATLAFYVILTLPVIIVLTFFFRIASRKAYRKVRANISKVNAFLAEHLSGMKIIQIFNQQERKASEFDERNKKLKYSYYRQILTFGVFRPTMYFVYIIATIIVFYFGGIGVIEGTISVGLLMTFYIFTGRLFEPINQLAESYNVIQSAFASSERIFGIMDTVPQVLDDEDSIELTDIKGEIEFKDVWFKYVEDEWVLKGVSFHVSPKDSVAFVGATGSGKTTILSLITRNYDIQQGQILIDGIDIRRIKKSSLRSFIGQMLQDVFMFSGTIESNIKLRSDDITQEEMEQACEYVNANYFINKLDNRFDEEVRERGNNFSSGQRQLLSFARTLVHKPKVMILDEATANIDTETEQIIQDSLEKMMTIGTMLIVAHRLSTIQHVDNIIVLSKGEIIEQGNHQELLKNKGHYFNLYKLQYQEK
mgnify:CR=1 FL=1